MKPGSLMYEARAPAQPPPPELGAARTGEGERYVLVACEWEEREALSEELGVVFGGERLQH